MADKKYYWLKLQKDFFKRHDIKIIKAMPNGKDYVIFYLTLLLESINHEGALRFSDTIPYNDDMLATITDTNIDIVRSAMKILTELNMIEILDDSTIYLAEISKMIGCENSVAERVRKHRDSQKASSEPLKLISETKTNSERQRSFRAKKICEEKQHIPFIEDYSNNKRYGGNYYIVIKRDKFKCSLCGSIENLCVHHIDGYNEIEPQNSRENKMITVCRHCHSNIHAGADIPIDLLESIDYFAEESNENNGICNTDVTACNKMKQKCNTEIELEKEIELEIDIENNGEEKSSPVPPKSKRFIPPTIEEVTFYCQERSNNVNAEKFVDHYTSNGWKVGKNPMKDWKASIRSWEQKDGIKNGTDKQSTKGLYTGEHY